MFGFGIFDYIKVGAGLIVGAALVFYPARWIGQGEGKQMAATPAASHQAISSQFCDGPVLTTPLNISSPL